MKKTLLTILFITTWLLTVSAQNIEGIWHAILRIENSAPLYIVFNIEKEGEIYSGTMDSPIQRVYGIELTEVDFANGELIVSAYSLKMSYEGTLTEEGTFEGEFSQGFLTADMTLSRLERPQEPQPPFPYRSENVVFENSAAPAVLAGTLTIPDNATSPCPAVVLVTGSGLQNRDEELFGHKPFLVIADYLSRNGIAVLRYDDRSYGESTGDVTSATTMDYAEDAICGFEYLLSRPEIDPRHIGIIGHSEGGTIAFIAAAKRPDIAFIVSLAGAALNGKDILLGQNYDAKISEGASEEEAAMYCNVIGEIFDVLASMDHTDILEDIDRIEERIFTNDANEVLSKISVFTLRTILRKPVNEWLKYSLSYDPYGDMAAVQCPVFALNGSKDIQVEAAPNLNRIEKALTAGRNRNFETRSYDSLNHLFQHAGTGQVAEYGYISETISPQVLNDIAEWIKSVTEQTK